MAGQDGSPGGHVISKARAGSPLACFGVNQEATRLYYIGADTGIHELTKATGGWHDQTLPLQSAAPNSPLACFGFDGTDPRVYYINQDKQITQVAPVPGSASQWTATPLPGEAADDSPFTCLGLNGTDCHLYFVGTDRQLHDVAADASGKFHDRLMPDTKVAPGSGLTCIQSGPTLVNLFHVDAADGNVHDLFQHYNADGPGGSANYRIVSTAPAPGSPLTCFGLKGTDDYRVYYLDRQNRINEVTGPAPDWTNNALSYTARPGGALTCFGVEGEAGRLYYLDRQAKVNELAMLSGDWTPKPLPGTAAPDSALTCFGFDGAKTRLYYIDAQHHVNELAWQTNKFVNAVL